MMNKIRLRSAVCLGLFYLVLGGSGYAATISEQIFASDQANLSLRVKENQANSLSHCSKSLRGNESVCIFCIHGEKGQEVVISNISSTDAQNMQIQTPIDPNSEYVGWDSGCGSSLPAGQSCSIYFYYTGGDSYHEPFKLRLTVSGTNTTPIYLNISYPCETFNQ